MIQRIGPLTTVLIGSVALARSAAHRAMTDCFAIQRDSWDTAEHRQVVVRANGACLELLLVRELRSFLARLR